MDKKKLLKLLEVVEIDGMKLIIKEFNENILFPDYKSYRIGTTLIELVKSKDVKKRSKALMDEVIELNEAFAAQALAVIHDLELSPEKVNPNGGAVALGHPVSATGAILVTKIISEMERNDYKLGLVTLCIGGGQGIALLLGRD